MVPVRAAAQFRRRALSVVFVPAATAWPNFVVRTSFYNIDVYPNPASNVINVRSEFTIDNLSIFDLMGRTVKQQISNNKEFSLDVSELAKGIYLVKLTSGEKEAVTKFIKK